MSWGYKLMLTFIVFAGMMSYLVIRCFQTNFELVEKEYYKSELVYQQVIDGAAHSNALSSTPELTQSGRNIVLQMPEEMKTESISGSILFYCAYDSRMDKKFSLSVDSNGKQFFNNYIKPGNYTVKINWSNGVTHYYAQKELIVL